ncbi:MAG: LLM class F420-dependent oxidoreductase [Candidatus Tectomicrobia bacterium]|nr:LLM class F420-dependent oxidoreductase [Candidatus Tectomicrobia bacterium]
MQVGLGLPHAGAAAHGPSIIRFAQRADELGFESLWCGDHILLPTAGTDQYPYTEDGSFPRDASVGFLETLTVLAYAASVTQRIRLGSTVIILPYRNPVVQAKMFASLDVLSGGRAICGVGVGWLEKEFDSLGVPYAERGPMSDEFLDMFQMLWTQAHPEFEGKYYQIHGMQFEPKPVQNPFPIWVGGHSRRAIRRTIKYGHAWHPTRQTPDYVAKHLPYLRQEAERAGRDPDSIIISLKRSLQITDIGLSGEVAFRSGNALVGTTQDIIDDAKRCQDMGMHQLTYDFRTDHIDEQIAIMEQLASRVVPAVV